MSLANGRTAVGLMTHGATQAGALADHSHAEYEDHGTLALAEHSHGPSSVINNTGTVYYTINGVTSTVTDPILTETVLDDYMRVSELPEGALVADDVPLGETSTNRQLVQNLLTIDPLDYMVAGSVPSNAIEITPERITRVNAGFETVDPLSPETYPLGTVPDTAIEKNVLRDARVAAGFETVDPLDYMVVGSVPANALENNQDNQDIVASILTTDDIGQYVIGPIPTNPLVKTDYTVTNVNAFIQTLTAEQRDIFLPITPTNVEVFNNILDEEDNLGQYVIGPIPSNALKKTDPSTLQDASGVFLTHQQVLDNILYVNPAEYIQGPLPSDAILDTELNRAEVAGIITTTQLNGYLDVSDLPNVTNHLGLRWDGRPAIGYDTVWASIETLHTDKAPKSAIGVHPGIETMPLQYNVDVWGAIEMLRNGSRMDIVPATPDKDSTLHNAHYADLWTAIMTLKTAVHTLAGGPDGTNVIVNDDGGGINWNNTFWSIGGGSNIGSTTTINNVYTTTISDDEIRLAVVSHNYIQSPVLNDNGEEVALPWTHDFTAYLTSANLPDHLTAYALKTDLPVLPDLTGYIPVSDYPYVYTNPWYDITGGGITSDGNLVFNSNDSTSSFTWTDQSANCMVLLGNAYSFDGVGLGGNLGIGSGFSTYNPALWKLPQYKLHVDGDIKADTHGAGGSQGGSIIAARDITAAGDITATGGIFGANIGTKDASLVDDANYNTVWSSIKHLSGQIGTGGSGGSYDDTALTNAMWGTDGAFRVNNLSSAVNVFASVNGGLATHDGVAQLTTSLDVYNMLNMTSGFLLRINEAISGVNGDKGRDDYTALDPPAYDSLWSSINTLDSHVGVMPTTTHYDHTYFGWAPTVTVGSWIHTSGVEVIQGGVNIVDCGLLTTDGTDTQRMRFGAFTFNKDPNKLLEQGEIFNFRPQNDDIGWHTHWDRETTPLWYVQATKPIDGTDLTFRHHTRNTANFAESGLIVSAASPDGPWVQRGFWDSTTPRTVFAGSHIVVSSALGTGTAWESLHFPENLAGTTTLWQVCVKLQAEVNALKTYNARLSLLEHFVHDAWRQTSGGTGQRDRLTEWTDFQY